MPFNLNKVQIAGTLTRDPEVKYTPKGTAIADISLAINRVWKDDQNQKHEEVTFVNVDLFGRTAEVVGEYCKKGHCIYIEGRLKLDTWDDKQTGQKRSKLKIQGTAFSFVSTPQGSRDEQRGEYQEQQPSKDRPTYGKGFKPPTQPAKPYDPDLDGPMDDIPF